MPYFGGKQRVAPALVELFPAHEHYVEPYCGGLSVLLAKRPSKLETVNDLDGDLVTFWRMLRDRPDDLERVCSLTPHSRAEYAAAFAREPELTDLERARRVWVQLTQGRGANLRSSGWRFNADASGTGTGLPGYLSGYVDRMPPAARRLHHVSIECRPALEVIEQYGASPSTLLYVDPPYLGATRSPRARYTHEMLGAAEHVELADALHKAAAAVVLSGYASPLYDDLFGDWHRASIAAWTGNGGDGERDRTEVVWSNRPLHTAHTLDFGAAS